MNRKSSAGEATETGVGGFSLLSLTGRGGWLLGDAPGLRRDKRSNTVDPDAEDCKGTLAGVEVETLSAGKFDVWFELEVTTL